MKPTVGRIVWFCERGGLDEVVPVPAIITRVTLRMGDSRLPGRDEDDYVVWLRVFSPSGDYDAVGRSYSPAPTINCWTWPPREG